MKRKFIAGLLAWSLGMMVVPGQALATGQSVGKVVAVRGAASILRGGSEIKAQVSDGLLAADTVKTGAGGRAKLLFIDDSVLTMSENSTMVVQEFIHAKGKVGSSIFNLLDGKMRSVVGKTKFEVRTPTAVAAARGTVIFFDVGSNDHQSYSRIICLEGVVEVKSALPSVRGMITLTPGTMVTVKAGVSPPPPVKAPPAELEKVRKATSGGTHQEQASSAGTAAQSSTAQDSANSKDAAAGQDQQGAAGQQEGTQAAKAALLPDTQESSPALAAAPTITGTTTAALALAPPVQLPPALKQPTRVNIVIGIPTSTTH